MIKAKILRNYRYQSPANQFMASKKVWQYLTDNIALFPNLPMTLAAFDTIIQTYETKIIAAESGDKKKYRSMKIYEEKWAGAMDQMANYVESVANGDAIVISKSGFQVAKTEKGKLQRPEVMNIHIYGTHSHGQIKVKSVNKTNAKGVAALASVAGEHQVEFRQMDDHQIGFYVDGKLMAALVLTTKHRCEFNQLPRGKEGRFMMVGFNAAGMGPLSDVRSDVIIP